jgi:hypothetical protein
MKKLLLFSLCAVLLMSCGGAGHDPSDNITWGQAFNHVSHSFTYWLFVIITGLFLLLVTLGSVIQYKKGEIDGSAFAKRVFVALVIFAFAFFMRPCEVAANTTVEQAARGVWIGY